MVVRRSLTALAVYCASIAVVSGDVIGLGQTRRCSVYTSGEVLTVIKDDVLDPASIDAPQFWFDASDTSQWSFDGSKVVKIPSKSSSRSLEYAKPADWPGWTDTETSAPVYSACDEESGLPCVDFGDRGSGRILMFDGGALKNIGTVIAVFNARNWGGWLFGGENTSNGIWNWHRGRIADNNYYDTVFDYRNPIARGQRSHNDLVSSVFRQNSLAYVPVSVGFAGGWEVYSLNPTNATGLSAAGLGFNDFSGSMGRISGGMKYAELLIYDRLLDVATVAKIERFLARKWGLSAILFGHNGKAHIDLLYAAFSDTSNGKDGMRVELDVPAGCELSVAEVRGGHNPALKADAKLVKTGEGSLKVGDFSRYSGKLELHSGNLALKAVASPDAATGFDYPDGVACRFDVSDRNTLHLTEESGVEYINRIDDADGRVFAGDPDKIINLRSRGVLEEGGDQRPWISDEYVTSTGLRMLDSGNWVANTGVQTQYSRGLEIGRGDETGNIGAFTTVIAAIGAQRGGGWLLDGGFQRALQSSQYAVGLLNGKVDLSNGLTPADGVAYIDGVKVEDPVVTGYPDSGYHVVCLQIPGSISSHVGELWRREGGGLILGELIAWNRPLTESEIIDVQDRLSRKWFGKPLPRRKERSDDVPSLQTLSLCGEASVTVDKGCAYVGTLEMNAPLVKKGPGTLYVRKIVNELKFPLTVEEGKIMHSPSPGLMDEGIAAAPSLRIDLADTNGWTVIEQDGRRFVSSLPAKGEAGIKVYQNTLSWCPEIRDDKEFVAKDSVPVLDFREYNESGNSVESGRLGFDKYLESVRSVYMVWRLRPGSNAFLLGADYSSSQDKGTNSVHISAHRYDFHRGNSLEMWGSNTAKAIRDGRTLTNGVEIAADKIVGFKPVEDSWQLVEVHTVAGVHASALGIDRHSQRAGGYALAEVIVYERELSEREKIATRNYLMKKWLGKDGAELEPVPEASASALELPVLEVNGSAEVSGAYITELVGSGTLLKTGNDELSLRNVGSFTGSVVVAGGNVNFKGVYRAEPKMASEGLRMRLAADERVVLVDNSNGTRGVLEWCSSVGDGWKAVAPVGYVINAESDKNISRYAPLYVAESELNGLPVVDMPKRRCFRFMDPQGDYASVTGICSVFWVVGSERGGGYLLGGGDLGSTVSAAKDYAWHRGSNASNTQSAGQDKSDPVIASSSSSSFLKGCTWRKNDVKIDPTTETLSGAWDQLTCSAPVDVDDSKLPGASGLAFDGRIFDGNPVNCVYVDRAGNQALAEILIYTNVLSETEILQTEAYLNCKWGLNNALSALQKSVRLVVAEGASAGFESGSGELKSVSGAGTVNGDVSVGELVVDFSTDQFFTVGGRFTLRDGLRISFAAPPDDLPAEIKLLEASEIEGIENGRTAELIGVDGDKVKVTLSFRDGALYAKARRRGKMVIVVR